MTRRIEIRPATASDLPAAIALLRDADLPTEDLTTGHMALVAEGEAEMLGVIGLEIFGDVGLLRSLVVSPLARGEGIGRLLAEALELSVRESGIVELWLLTINADTFFSTLGFRVRSRDAAPDAIRGSKEFSTLCPGDAVLMSKEM
jgi:N-acetylglutamate synthase-like GNAT family acetyltransferase